MNNTPKHGQRLLKRQEIEEIYGLPTLSELERDQVFHLTEQENKYLSRLHTSNSKFLFILQLGLFKAKKRFYTLEELDKDSESKEYIQEKYFKSIPLDQLSLRVTNPTRLTQQSYILHIFGYRKCSGSTFSLFEKEVNRLSCTHANPSYIVREALRFLERQRVITPAYSTLQNVVGMAVQSEIKRAGENLDKGVFDYSPLSTNKESETPYMSSKQRF